MPIEIAGRDAAQPYPKQRSPRRTRECRGRLPIARAAVANGRSAGGNPRPLALLERRGKFDVSGLLV